MIPDTILSLIASQAYLIPLDGVSSADILRVVSMIFCLYFISSLFTYLLVARGDQSRLLRVNLIVATFNIVGNIIVIPTYSFMGSAWVTVVSQILLVILTAHATRHIVRFDFLPRVSLIILATGLLSGYLVLLARDPLALWLGGFGLAHYLFLTLEVLLLSSLFAFIYFLPIVLRKLLRPSPLS